MKLIISDYDNTFYKDEQTIQKNIIATKEFMIENRFAIATGRTYMNFKKVDDIYHIPYDYLIINHGATILKNNVVIYNRIIKNNIKNKLLIDLYLEHTIKSYGCLEKENTSNLTKNNLTKICVEYGDVNLAHKIYNELILKYKNELKFFLVDSNKTIEIVSDGVDKAGAIKEIALIENIHHEDIYTIGDSYNDLEMIKTYNGYAMKNAINELKRIAKKEYNAVFELIEDIKRTY